LRYTDILFGFVLRELFIRLQNYWHADRATQLHLLVGITLILGSWIGFRRSLHRSSYQLKFFNLPLIQFLVDQLMFLPYFRIAVLTPAPDATTGLAPLSKPPSYLAPETVKLVFWIFVLYAVWDGLGVWMAVATKTVNASTTPRYPKLKLEKDAVVVMTAEKQSINWSGISITVVSLLVVGMLWFFADCLNPSLLLLTTAALLVAYRWCKEIRTSYQSSRA
jgi:hypothetical protein